MVLNLVCPVCEKPLRVVYFKNYADYNLSKYFLGCSGYPDCEFKFDFWRHKVRCPECDKILTIRSQRKEPYQKFIGCSGYPACTFTLNFIRDCDKIQEILNDKYNAIDDGYAYGYDDSYDKSKPYQYESIFQCKCGETFSDSQDFLTHVKECDKKNY